MHKSVEEEIEQFIGDLSLLPGKNTVVLVEDREDFAFWERLLQEFAPSIKPDFPLAFKSGGKDTLRKYADHVSNKVLMCVDSDNDSYRQSNNSHWMHPRRPFIYQTYSHSRENHLIHPGNLRQDCMELAHTVYDFQTDFEAMSESLFPWLEIWLFFSDERRKWLNDVIPNFEKEISWGKLNGFIETCIEEGGFVECQATVEALNCFVLLEEKLIEHRQYLVDLVVENGYEFLIDEWDVFQQTCSIEPQESLWFIQGHCAFDNIILPYFGKIVSLLSLDLATNAASKENKNHWNNRGNQSNQYRDLLRVSYRNCLAASQRCRFFDKIKADMENDFTQPSPSR